MHSKSVKLKSIRNLLSWFQMLFIILIIIIIIIIILFFSQYFLKNLITESDMKRDCGKLSRNSSNKPLF